MTKKNSVWLTVLLIIIACAITFQLTVIFGDVFVRDRTIGEVPTEYTDSTGEPEGPGEILQKTPADEITERVSEKIYALAWLYTNYYVGELNIDDLVEGAAVGFAAYSGDKYGSYHSAEEYASLTEGYSGEFAGIGVSVSFDPDAYAIEILNVMPDSPALEVGLLPNDMIVGVGGVNITEIGYDEAVKRIRGEIGTEVTLTIARGEAYNEVFDVTVTRRKVEEQVVTYETIKVEGISRPVAHIRLLDFNDKTPEQFLEALAQGSSDAVHGYILDVRNNGGGELSSITEILDRLLPEGPIVRIQYKDGTEQVITSDKNDFSGTIVVLANGNTASAAELFVAALRDYGKAIVVGTTTYGKGTVQTIVPFEDGSALRISSAMYAPPYSENYEGVGITPDVEADLADEYKSVNLFKLDHENDAQLQAALALFR